MSVHRGGCLVWGVGGLLPGGCLLLGVPASGRVPVGDPPRTATAAGGTHPTGMHSCWCRHPQLNKTLGIHEEVKQIILKSFSLMFVDEFLLVN